MSSFDPVTLAVIANRLDSIVREMENTPNSSHCNHGRPTYIELKLADIERLFGRR